MNAPAGMDFAPDATEPARLGLALFAARRGVDLSGALAPEDLGDDLAARWEAALAREAERPARRRLDRLAEDFALGAAERHLAALVVAVETDWRIGAAVARLQGPGEGGALEPRPTLHLAEALAETLFAARLPPLALAGSPLLAAGALRLLGSGPTPFRRLETPAPLAAILAEGPPAWPDAAPLGAGASEPNAETAAALAAIAPQIAAGEAGALAIRAAPAAGREAAVALARILSLRPLEVSAAAWSGDAALHLACRYARILPVVALALAPGEQWAPPALARPAPAIYLIGTEGAVASEDCETLALKPPDRDVRARLWSGFAAPEEAERLADIAALDETTIRRLGAGARLAAGREGGAVDAARVLATRRAMGTERLARLAQLVARPAPAEALILPEALGRRFDRLIDRCRARERVARDMGPALGGEARLGVTALFAGPSGAGKTFAASRLAERLSTPLWRLDLSAVMNKYIGETEKNLSAALDEAEALDVALLLDEADALFARRGDGDGEGERFANMLTNHLLTRLEAHRGVTVLTTNARGRMDPAFLRRFDFVFDFPLPGFEERLAIWRAHLGARAPDEAACRLLAAEVELPGGFVRTAALNAAAAAPGIGPIPLAALAEAAVEEHRKLGRAAPEALSRILARR